MSVNVMTTLHEYLSGAGCSTEMTNLIELVAAQAIPIRKAFFSHQTYTETENIYGEQQAELDKWADQQIISEVQKSGLVREIASEEQSEVVTFPDSTGEFALVMDPLDGSSLIQVNLCVGTIVGIYNDGKALQKGENMAAAMYMLYGPMTVLTLTVGKGVQIFALSEENEYILTEENVEMPEGTLYGSGGLKKDWTPEHMEFIDQIEKEGCKLRYSGSFVADFHQILKYGGIYCYPATLGKKEGKLRLAFEANPIGFIARQAGGAITDGTRDLLSVVPEKHDQRTPLYVGSKGLINKLEKIMKR